MKQSASFSLSRKIFLLVAGLLLLHAGFNDWMASLGRAYPALLPLSTDIFADSIKVALAERSISAPLLTAARVHSWAPLFQYYLFHNPYLTPYLSVYLLPPLSTLQAMGIAALIITVSPIGALLGLLALYVGLVCVVSLLIPNGYKASAGLLLFSYPAIFMFDRGNCFSGFTSIGLALYFLTAATGTRRWTGVAGLAYAANVRPNTMIILLFEFLAARSQLEGLGRIIAIGFISLLVGAAALGLSHAIDHYYSLTAFLHGYNLYQTGYIHGDGGLLWNDSLYGAIRETRYLLGLPHYSARLSQAISLLSALSCAISCWVMLQKRATRLEGCYIALVLSSLFTPIDGEYHILAMAVPLLVFFAQAKAERQMTSFPLFAIAASVICLVAWLLPPLTSLYLLATGLTAIIFITALLDRDQPGNVRATEHVILASAALVLCPLGEQATNGPVVAFLLAAGGMFVLVACLRRPANAGVILDSK